MRLDRGMRFHKPIRVLLIVILVVSMVPASAFAQMRESLQVTSSPALPMLAEPDAEQGGAGEGQGTHSVVREAIASFQVDLDVVYDAQTNEAFEREREEAIAGKNPVEVDLSGWDGWSLSVDGGTIPALKADAFDPSEYGDVLGRDAAAAAVLNGMVSREQTIKVAVTDEVGAQDTIARSLVEEAFGEPAVSPSAGDYLYWHVRSWDSSAVYAKGGTTYFVCIVVDYNSDAAQEAWVAEETGRVLSSLDLQRRSASEKVAAIHDWLVLNVAYDNVHESDLTYRAQFSAYGALHDGTALCQGYATLFHRLCTEAGIPSRVISGIGQTAFGEEAHGWNIVEVGGAWYCVDCTWDSNLTDAGGVARHDYLLKSREDFGGHLWDERFTGDSFTRDYPLATLSYRDISPVPFVAVTAVNPVSFGEEADFKAELVGFPSSEDLEITWECSQDGGGQWFPLSPTGSASPFQLRVACKKDVAKQLYRCRVESRDGAVVRSVPTGFRWRLYAEAVGATVAGDGVTGAFFAKVSGEEAQAVSYRWQVCIGGSWNDCPSSVQGSDSDEMLLVCNEEHRNQSYRCIVTSNDTGRSFTTDEVTFQFEDLVVDVSSQPVAAYGETAALTAATNVDALLGAALSYRWEWTRAGASWAEVPLNFEGRQSDRLVVPGAWVRKGYSYRCIVNAVDGRYSESSAATFALAGVEASASASEVTGFGEVSTFTVSTNLDGLGTAVLRYRWQYSDDGAAWKDCLVVTAGSRSSRLSDAFTAQTKGCSYRCVVTTIDGRSAVTAPVGFRVAKLKADASASVAAVGEEATLVCSASGAPLGELTFQWRERNVATDEWTYMAGASSTQSEVKVAVTDESAYENEYSCIVRSEDGRVACADALRLPKPDAPHVSIALETEAVRLGETAVFECVLDGGKSGDLRARIPGSVKDNVKTISYQCTDDGGFTFEDCDNNSSNEEELKVKVTDEVTERLYRAVAYDQSGNEIVSEAVPLKVSDIVARVSTSRVVVGQTAVLVCKLVGEGADDFAYQWQSSSDAIEWADLDGEASSALSVKASADAMALQYRCKVRCGAETVAISESVALDVDVSVPEMSYRAHVRDVGWFPYARNGAIAGTTGKGLPVEALCLKLEGPDGESAVSYQVHVENEGWLDWVGSNETAGKTGEAKQLEAIRVKLADEYAGLYNVYYRVHVGNLGWLGWAKNGETAGSTGIGARVEAVQVKLVPKGEEFDVGGFHKLSEPTLTYRAHVANVGWTAAVGAGKTAGTTGQSKRMEALRVFLADFDGVSNGVNVRVHVADEGWQNAYVPSGQVAGTTGKSRAIECVVIQLAGKVDIFYDVYYRVHVQDLGWLGWAMNNEWAGTTGGGKAVEAIQVKIVPKKDRAGVQRGGAAYKRLS